MSKSQDVNSRKLFLFEGSQEEFEQIQALFESGELSELLGVEVLDVGVVPESQPNTTSQVPIKLSDWFQNIFEAGWQTVEELFSTQAGNPAFSARSVRENNANNPPEKGVNRGKLIDLGIQVAGNPVALIVTLTPAEADKEFDVCLRVYPADGQIYLPPNLQLVVLDETGATCLKTKARSADNWIQLEFSGQAGERFSVKVALGDVNITEDFLI
jgi:hypothetical protein